MEKPRENGIKDRLLQAGRVVFAEKGLNNATIREICDLAGANVAAVNYHFGSKEKLYISVLQDFLEDRAKRYPFDLKVTARSCPEERLRAYVRGFLYKILGSTPIDQDPVNQGLGRLVMQELIEPSQYFGVLSERYFLPSFNRLVDIVRQLAPGLDAIDASHCASSIVGQCVLFDFTKQSIARMIPEMALEAGNIESVMDFIMDFSLGGIERLRALRK